MPSTPPPVIEFYQIILVIFLVLLNALFVAAEFSLVKIRSSQLESIDATPVVNLAKFIVNDLNAYLAATQLGITLASLALGWVGESIVNQLILELLAWLDLNLSSAITSSISIGCAFILITVMHIVFGELAPKALAISHPITTLLTVAWPLRLFYLFFKPAIWFFNGMANLILKPLNLKPAEHKNLFYSEDELKLIISASQESGAIAQSERELIENVFDFDERKVYSILTPRSNVKAIELHSTLKDALQYATECGHSRYPVYDGNVDNIVGVLSTKSLTKKLLLTNDETANLIDIVRKPLFIAENTKIRYALKQMQKKYLQLAIITNEVGEFVGVVSIEDIVEELVGEMGDEDDNDPQVVTAENEHSFLIMAHKSLADINKHLPFKFEESESYTTLAGLIHSLYAEKELQVGDKIELSPYLGHILKMHRNSVENIRLELTDPQQAEPSQEKLPD